jgi:hypothetical protein
LNDVSIKKVDKYLEVKWGEGRNIFFLEIKEREKCNYYISMI